MFADACRVISIFTVIAVSNIGLALLLIVILPVVFLFTRFIQKRMLASQLENRVAVAGVSGHVQETIRNIRTIHTLDKEKYMEDLYDERIDRSYRAVEKINFCDAVYSPVITILNAATVGVVMLLSASGNASVLSFFGMSVGASVAVMNYIAGIFTPIESLGMEIQTVQSALSRSEKDRRVSANLPERDIPDETKRHIFGYVEQTFRPVPSTVLDQLTLGDPAVTKEMAIRAAKTVGPPGNDRILPRRVATRPEYRDEIFSQGERQLLSVARAISPNLRCFSSTR